MHSDGQFSIFFMYYKFLVTLTLTLSLCATVWGQDKPDAPKFKPFPAKESAGKETLATNAQSKDSDPSAPPKMRPTDTNTAQATFLDSLSDLAFLPTNPLELTPPHQERSPCCSWALRIAP